MQVEDNENGCRRVARQMAIVLLVFISTPLLIASCCALAKFPPQIFGKNEDHFRAFVIDPIPESVEILDVEFSDLIIHPDVAYFFRFSVNRDDLEKIIATNSLQATSDECFDPSPSPSWWKFPSPSDMEIYQYRSDGGLIISLCYDTSNNIAFYAFWTH